MRAKCKHAGGFKKLSGYHLPDTGLLPSPIARFVYWWCCIFTSWVTARYRLPCYFYSIEFFGVVTNLLGGWLGARFGLNKTIFGIIFAINSAVHSFLILDYSDHDKVSLNVGFYYMANAGGRLTGTILSGLVYQWWGLVGCLWISSSFVIMAGLLSMPLIKVADSQDSSAG